MLSWRKCSEAGIESKTRRKSHEGKDSSARRPHRQNEMKIKSRVRAGGLECSVRRKCSEARIESKTRRKSHEGKDSSARRPLTQNAMKIKSRVCAGFLMVR